MGSCTAFRKLAEEEVKQIQRSAAKKDKKKEAAVPEADEVAIDPITGEYDFESVAVLHGAYACVYFEHVSWRCME